MATINLRYFTPLKSEPKRQALIAFDVEGVGGPGGFVCGSVATPDGTRFFTDPDLMWAYLCSNKHGDAWRVAFNLEYDLAVLNLDALLSSGALLGGGGLLWFDWLDDDQTEIRFTDAARLYRGYGLHGVGMLLGLAKLPLSVEAIRSLRAALPFHTLPKHLRAEIEAYNRRDAELTLRAVERFQDVVARLGGQLRPTLASCALDLYRRKFMPHAWTRLGEATNRLARESYYGARCEPFLMDRTEGVNGYDVNSLYPYIGLVERFPDPGYLDLETRGTLPRDLAAHEGVAAVRVRVPTDDPPPLPCRVGGSLFFPSGVWYGVYCLNELRYAMGCGVEVLGCDWSLTTRKTFNPFGDYVESLYAERRRLAEVDDPDEQIIKLLLNSLFGKFGVRTDEPLTTIETITGPFDSERDRGLVWRSRMGVDFLERPVESYGPPLYANVMLAAYVAAGARVFLHRHLVEHARHLVYCDTDSIITGSELPTGDGLGEWKQTLAGGVADVIGPKEYRVIMACGGVKAYAKGVPRELASQYVEMGWARYERALSLREAYARQRWPSEWVEVFKQSHNPTPKRCPVQTYGGSSGPTLTLPWGFEILQALKAAHLPALDFPGDAASP